MAPKGKAPLKKQQEPLIVFIRLYGTAKKRMQTVCRKYSSHHNDIATAGMMKEILRLEMHADELDPAVSVAATEARKLGLDPEQVLRRAIEDTTENRALPE